jgi:hypothetical protein
MYIWQSRERWGILWRKLLFDIQGIGKVVTAAMLLHYFFVDKRESNLGFNSEDADYFPNFSLCERDERAVVFSEAPSPVATDNNKPHPVGRPYALMTDHTSKSYYVMIVAFVVIIVTLLTSAIWCLKGVKVFIIIDIAFVHVVC